MSKQRKRKLFFTALAFMLPFLILYTVFTIWPVIQGFYVSMHKWGLMGKQKYIGFDNYIKFAGDKKFWSALGNTCKFVVITAPMLVIIALILALLANRQTVMKKGLRISYYLPSILSVSVASFIAKNTFSPYNGLLNGVLHQLHILPANTELQFLLDPKLVWVTISVMTVWWTIGFTMIFTYRPYRILIWGSMRQPPSTEQPPHSSFSVSRFRCFVLPQSWSFFFS